MQYPHRRSKTNAHASLESKRSWAQLITAARERVIDLSFGSELPPLVCFYNMYLKALICIAKLTWFLLLVQSCHTTVWRLEGRSDNVQYAQFHFYAHLPLFGQGFGPRWMIVVKYETWERWIRLCLISLKAKSELHKAYIKLYYLYINIFSLSMIDSFVDRLGFVFVALRLISSYY